MRELFAVLWLTGAALAAGAGCHDAGGDRGTGDGGADADADTDTDADTDIDADAGADTDADSDSDADCPANPFDSSMSPYEGGEESVDLEVVAVEFFGCPHCGDFWQYWEELLANRPDIRVRVRLYFHHYPFDYADSWSVHAMALAASYQGMERFWQLHDHLFTALIEDETILSPEEVRAYCAEDLGLDMDQFDEDATSEEALAILEWDKGQAQAVGVTGVPSVFVCGEKIAWSELESIIDEHL